LIPLSWRALPLSPPLISSFSPEPDNRVSLRLYFLSGEAFPACCFAGYLFLGGDLAWICGGFCFPLAIRTAFAGQMSAITVFLLSDPSSFRFALPEVFPLPCRCQVGPDSPVPRKSAAKYSFPLSPPGPTFLSPPLFFGGVAALRYLQLTFFFECRLSLPPFLSEVSLFPLSKFICIGSFILFFLGMLRRIGTQFDASIIEIRVLNCRWLSLSFFLSQARFPIPLFRPRDDSLSRDPWVGGRPPVARYIVEIFANGFPLPFLFFSITFQIAALAFPFC